jgi:hypothetical protein
MMRALQIFFTVLGVIFFAIILFAAYFAYTSGIDPRVLFTSSRQVMEGGTSKDAHPYLSASQEASLRAVGINPAAVPTSLTDTQKACLLGIVGEARAAEIIGGATPTAAEFFKAQGCL